MREGGRAPAGSAGIERADPHPYRAGPSGLGLGVADQPEASEARPSCPSTSGAANGGSAPPAALAALYALFARYRQAPG